MAAETVPDRLKAALADRYHVERVVGAGGMATVYLARDLKHERDVALKVLRPELSAMIGAERFLAEIRITAALDHPHILTLIDSGENDGFLWCALPYVRGVSLRARLQSEPQLPIEDALTITRQVASALDYAHHHGVVHRDIKPENILLFEGEAMLTDFGIAIAVGTAADQRITGTGVTIGTPQYMSPEQATGDRNLNARSDVYSLAAVLYEMLAGVPPHTGPNPQAVIARMLTQPVTPPRSVRASVPLTVDRAVIRALGKSPADRFAGVSEFVAALAAPPAARDKSIGVLPFVSMSADRDNEYFADGITEDLITALSKVDALRVPSRTSAFAFKGKDQDVRSIGEQLGVATVLEGSVRRAGTRLRITAQLISVTDGYHLWSETYDRELRDVFAVQDEITSAIVAALKVKLVGSSPMVRRYTDNVEAYGLYLEGRFFWHKRSVGSVWKGIDCFKRALTLAPDYALAHVGLADSYNILGFYSALPPGESFPEAAKAARRALALDDQLAEAHTSLAYVQHYYDWDWDTAERSYLRAMELNRGYATAPQFYCNYLASRGRWDDALRAIRRALELDPLSLIARAAEGWVLYWARRYEEAAQPCLSALELDPTFAPAHRWLGWIREQQGRLDEAIDSFRQAAAHSGSGAENEVALGHAYALAGRTDDAQSVLGAMAELAESRYVPQYGVATIHAALGDADSALACLSEAVRRREHDAVFLRVDPKLDALRRDARFAALVSAVGLD